MSFVCLRHGETPVNWHLPHLASTPSNWWGLRPNRQKIPQGGVSYRWGFLSVSFSLLLSPLPTQPPSIHTSRIPHTLALHTSQIPRPLLFSAPHLSPPLAIHPRRKWLRRRVQQRALEAEKRGAGGGGFCNSRPQRKLQTPCPQVPYLDSLILGPGHQQGAVRIETDAAHVGIRPSTRCLLERLVSLDDLGSKQSDTGYDEGMRGRHRRGRESPGH